MRALRVECREAGSGTAPVRADLLRNHARLFSQVRLPVRDLALLLDLVDAEAARRQLALPHVQALIERFFARRQIADGAARQAWCTANDVTDSDVAGLARFDFLREELGCLQAPRVGRRMVDALKLTGDYPAVRDHVGAKWRALDEHQARALRQGDIGTPDQIDSWYAAQAGVLPPHSGTRLGFAAHREFLDELNFEYFYARLGSAQE